ncbi:hypothetical protein EOPP23_15525 [Endozoicomonas sp. OPT23]|uniref:response regulator n=1 Tax=Endozoicomonas sp. OPT23 TaxID=2072845 RepID=UPI00129B4457|nr:response regulator [Endozoicomonas sp. OPT23]MRI34399.1 hypothetical protein [Endozoicomonas sp. OPT23]
MPHKALPRKALIVDDSKVACKVLANLLDSFDLEADSVYSAEEAIEFLKDNKPDIIFMDHHMPDMNGFEAVKVVKDNPMTATIPVMMYTSQEGNMYVSQARALGAVDVVPKGVEKRQLRESLFKLGLVADNAKQANVKSTSDQAGEEKRIDAKRLEPPVQVRVETERLKVDGSDMVSLWLNHIKPFLSMSAVQQTEQLHTKNADQTGKIVKETQKMLEHFEHVMTTELNSQRRSIVGGLLKTIREGQSKVRMAIVTLVVVQAAVIWQLWGLNSTNSDLLKNQQQIIEQLQKR